MARQKKPVHRKRWNGYVFPAFPGAGGSINDGILDAALTPKLIQPTTFAEISGNTSERAKKFSKILKHSHIPYQQGKRYAYVAALPSGYGSSDCRCILWSRLSRKSRKRMEDREKNSKKTEKKFLLFKEKVYLPIRLLKPLRLVLILYRNGLMRAWVLHINKYWISKKLPEDMIFWQLLFKKLEHKEKVLSQNWCE